MTASSPPVNKAFGWRFTSPLLLGSTLNPLNSSMLATGLVGIGLDFHRGPVPPHHWYRSSICAAR